MLELNRKNMKKIACLIAFGIILYLGLQHLEVVGNVFSYLLKLLMPFIMGLCLAFLLNIPLRKIESMLLKIKNKKKKKQKISMFTRGLAITISFILIIGILMLVLFLVIPELINTFEIFKENIPSIMGEAKQFLQNMTQNYPEINQKISEFKFDWNSINEQLLNIVKVSISGALVSSVNFIIGIFTGITNFVMGLIFAVYILMQKEKLLYQIKKLLYAYIPKEKSDSIVDIAKLTHKTFSDFMGGQFVEACILGVLCFIGMAIFKFPYALTISVLIGFTALIPVFGAFIGVVVGMVLITVTNPMQAIWFLVYFLVLQQIEGNFIYPKVVGNSVGLPAMWVMLAIIIGGSALGILGMLISVPLASIIYCLLRNASEKRLKEKKILIKK